MRHLLTMGRHYADVWRAQTGVTDYDPNAIAALEHEMRLNSEKYPDTREVNERAIAMLSNYWARFAMMRVALK